MRIKLSFILPCYNVAPYVGRCIESIEHQDMPQDEYEIICVDDCSPDNTGEVIKEYQKQYNNIVYYRHEVNKTSGGARNTGIDLAKGKYIWFVDPDDAIVDNVLQIVFSKAEERATDLLLFNMRYTDEMGQESECRHYVDSEVSISGQDYVVKYCKKKNLYEVASHVSCLFNRNFIRSNKLHYPEIKSSQDVVFVWKSILLAQRVSSIDTLCYRYIRRPNSMTGSSGKKKVNAILSASILYSYELQKILDAFDFIDGSLPETIKRDIKGSVNNDSRTIFSIGSCELFTFYHGLNEHSVKLDRLQEYMDRKTKNIFNYRLPYFLWWTMIKGYKLLARKKR